MKPKVQEILDRFGDEVTPGFWIGVIGVLVIMQTIDSDTGIIMLAVDTFLMLCFISLAWAWPYMYGDGGGAENA